MKEKRLSALSDWLKEVSSDSPCGEDLVEVSFEYQALEAKVDVTTESSDWKKHQQEMEAFLTKTKDIRLYSLYTRILIHTEKKPLLGLIKGLQLILYAMENHWDCCYPEIDKSDPEEAFFDRNNALADFVSYKDLILQLSKKITILSIGLGNYTLEDLLVLEAGGAVSDKQPLHGLMPDEEAAYDELLDYFALSLDLAEAIKTLYHQKSNEVFTEFNDHLLPMLKKGVALKGGEVKHSSAASDGKGGTASEGGNAPPVQIQGTINNRDDIIKALGLICDYYEKNEPSSPVPMMLGRVTKMVNMNYREIFTEFQLGADSALDKIFGQADKK